MMRLVYTGFLCSLLAAGCSVEQLDVAYIEVPEIEIQDPAAVGELNHRVVGVRAVLNATSLGFYPLPASIPILATGAQRIRLEPVVNRSGLSEEFVAYPMFDAYVDEPVLVAGATDTVRPSLPYVDQAAFVLTEDFQGGVGSFPIDLDGDGVTSLTLFNDPLGRGSVGKVSLTAANPIFEVASVTLPPIPDAREVWLELEFRGDAVLSLTLLPEQPGEPQDRGFRFNQGALPREEWRTFYFDLRNEINDQLLPVTKRLGLLAAFDPAVDLDQQEVFIDNIRLVYR